MFINALPQFNRPGRDQMDDPTGAAPPASTGGGAREEMVANGVAFLLHPRVQQAPLSQRITFLERKVRVLGR